MPKGYWIANNTVTDPEAYGRYRDTIMPIVARHGGRFIVRAGRQEMPEAPAHPRSIVIEFASLDAARACYDDPEYQAAKLIRLDASEGMLVIVEGYDG